jgi:hypothetical protein
MKNEVIEVNFEKIGGRPFFRERANAADFRPEKDAGRID